MLNINGIFNNVLKDLFNKGLKAPESNNKDLLNNVHINLEKACLKYEREYTNYLLENNDPRNIYSKFNKQIIRDWVTTLDKALNKFY